MTEAIRFGCATSVGNVRDINEDTFAIDSSLGLWVLADGMGGYNKGDVASGLVTKFIVDSIKTGALLKDAVSKSHNAIIHAGIRDPSTAGMGATVVALKINGKNYEIAWMGDSRAYLWNGQLRQLTRDHSFIQDLLDAEVINPKDAKSHPQRSVVQRAAGMMGVGNVEADLLTGLLNEGEQILLCSDGLTNELEDEVISKILESDESEQDKANQLIKSALVHGGADNITVILVSLSNLIN